MSQLMNRLGHLARRWRWALIGVWIVLVAFSLPFAGKADDNLSAGISSVEGSQSETVTNALSGGQFGSAGLPGISVVVTPGSDATADDRAKAVTRIEDAAKQTPKIVLSSSAVSDAQQAAQASDKPFVVPLAVDASMQDAVDPTQDFIDAIDSGAKQDRVTEDVTGQTAIQAAQVQESQESGGRASSVSLIVMLILLLVAFGALVAAVVPLVLGFVAIAVTLMAIYFLSQALTISIFATSLASMIGLAVAVDYSLFILMRYREELARGVSHGDALGRAMATSAVAVTFSGVTVMASLAGLLLMPNSTVRSMALGAIIVVGVAILGACTLLPALLVVLGRSVERPGRVSHAIRAVGRALRRGSQATSTIWDRRTARVTRRPWVTVVATLVALLVLSYPLLRIDLDNNSIQQVDANDPARVGSNEQGRIQGPGSPSPTIVLVQFDSGTASDSANQQALNEVRQTLTTTGVASVSQPDPSQSQREALLDVVLADSPESAQAKSTVKELRDRLAGTSAAQTTTISVGGQTAAEIDFNNSITDSMWKIVLFILVVALVILTALLRSILLPLIGVAMNVLCVGAAYGVLVGIFQWGWLPFLGFEDFGFVDSVILPLLLAVVFGLSMDYQVFLLTRIREHHRQGVTTREAAIEGTRISARTITCAAAIMIGVFVVFVIFGVPTIQAAGLGAAVAVAASALLVQLAFMPSVMILLGDRVWWLPSWLDRRLPRVSVE